LTDPFFHIPPTNAHTQATTTNNVTGVWTPSTARTTLGQLRALEGNVTKAGASSSAFRLHMLAEVLSLVVPPLAEAAAEEAEAAEAVVVG
jgi:hypothetical protein